MLSAREPTPLLGPDHERSATLARVDGCAKDVRQGVQRWLTYSTKASTV